MAVQRLAGDIFAASAFALGTAISGYALAAMIGAGLAVAGTGALWFFDRRTDPAGMQPAAGG